MKKLKYILIFILSLGIFNSCLIDNEDESISQNDQGYNLAGFRLGNQTVAGVADQISEYDFLVDLQLIGPTEKDVANDITVTIGAAASSTAIAGTHYRIDNPTVVLEAAKNHLAKFEFTMLTDGIYAPLAEAPILVLEVVSATGDANVTNNGKPITIAMNYLCFSDLEGDYDVHAVITRSISGAVTTYDWTEFITETGPGEYRTEIVTYDGYVNPGPAGSTPGFTFYDVCNDITVPEQNLIEYYSNIVVGTAVGVSDPIAGTIHIEYSTSTTADAGNRNGVYDYTKQ